MHILGVHTGFHDASACLYKDFDLVAAVSLERLTRVKTAGVTPAEPMPDPAIDEMLVDRRHRPRRCRRRRRVEGFVRVSGFRPDRPAGPRTGLVSVAGQAPGRGLSIT